MSIQEILIFIKYVTLTYLLTSQVYKCSPVLHFNEQGFEGNIKHNVPLNKLGCFFRRAVDCSSMLTYGLGNVLVAVDLSQSPTVAQRNCRHRKYVLVAQENNCDMPNTCILFSEDDTAVIHEARYPGNGIVVKRNPSTQILIEILGELHGCSIGARVVGEPNMHGIIRRVSPCLACWNLRSRL